MILSHSTLSTDFEQNTIYHHKVKYKNLFEQSSAHSTEIVKDPFISCLKMKALFILGAFCLLGVFGHPQPDQDLKLDADALTDEIITPTDAKSKNKSFSQGTEPDRTRLLNDLLLKYDKKVNPDSVKLELGMCLIDFKVIEARNAIENYVWLRYTWEDGRLKWDPKEYGGVEVLRVDSTAIWKPDVTLYNSADPVEMVHCWDSNSLIYPNGKVLFVPPCKMTSQCNFSALKKQPYAEQECIFKMGSWTFDGNVLDLQFYNGTNKIDLSELQNSSGFEVVSTTGERHDRYYPCCADPYPDLTFNFTIRRLPAEELFLKL